jgi:hypothetical protein
MRYIASTKHPNRPLGPPSLPGALYPNIKRPGPEADHSPPSSFDINNERGNTSTPPACLHLNLKENYIDLFKKIRHTKITNTQINLFKNIILVVQ